jgi:hypothetical protein
MENLENSEIEYLFHSIDSNDNGFVSISEFEEAFVENLRK